MLARLPPRCAQRVPEAAPAGRARAIPSASRRCRPSSSARGLPLRCAVQRARARRPGATDEVLAARHPGRAGAGLRRWRRVVFVGGSLVPAGGHNVLEPAVAGKAVIVGPAHGELPGDRRRSSGPRARSCRSARADELGPRGRALCSDEDRRRASARRARARRSSSATAAPLRAHRGRAGGAASRERAGARWARSSAAAARAPRRRLPPRRLLPARASRGPVISVGNLSVGGSGKTPRRARGSPRSCGTRACPWRS